MKKINLHTKKMEKFTIIKKGEILKLIIILKDITNRYECGKILSEHVINPNIFNKEYEFGYDKYLYKFTKFFY
jgi:hypothetical protein